MSLQNCPDCGGKVSSYALNCPHCGRCFLKQCCDCEYWYDAEDAYERDYCRKGKKNASRRKLACELFEPRDDD